MKIFAKTAPAVIAALALIAGAWSFAGVPALAQSPSDTATPGADTATAPAEDTATAPADQTATAPAETPTAPAVTATGVDETPTAVQPSATITTPPTLQLPSGLPENEKKLLESLYAYNLDVSAVSASGFSPEDRAALDVLWAQNAGGLEMLRYGASHARSAQVRALIRVMGQMHLKDQALIDQFETQVSTCAAGGGASGGSTGQSSNGNLGSQSGSNGGSNSPAPCSTGSIKPGDMGASGAALSFSKVPVLPQSPLGMMGFKNVDLKGAFMDKITSASGEQFDQVFLVQMMAAHGFAIESAQTVQASASDTALRDLAGHLAQVETLHRLLVLQLADRAFGQDLTIVFPSTIPVTGQTPTATAAAETPTPSETVGVTGTPAPSETAGAAGTAAPTGTGTAAATDTVSPTGTAGAGGTGTPTETATP